MVIDAEHARYQWEKDVEGTWRRVEPAALPEWVKSKKSVRFAAAGGILCKRAAHGTVERYRLIQHKPCCPPRR